MLEADLSTTDDAFAGNDARYRLDDRLPVRFYNHPRLDRVRTENEGRPIFKEVPFIEIMIPGSRDVIMREARESDKQRFSKHFQRFMSRQEVPIEGTLLSEWPAVTRSQVEELKFFNVQTVEDLANLSDGNSNGMMGIQILKQKAVTFLESADKNATSSALANANSEIEVLKAQMAEILATRRGEITEPGDIDAPAPTRRTRRTKAEMQESAQE